MSKSELLIYQGKDGLTQLSVKLEEETVWLNQNQLAELFQTTKQNVGQHIKNILADGELEAPGTVKEFFTVAREGRRNVNEHEVFLYGGKVSHEEAEAHALSELETYSKALDGSRPDELDKAMKRLKGNDRNQQPPTA